MKDIARDLGVSVATVSRALKDSPRISEEKRKLIKQYAEEHNFLPNVLAESLRKSRVQPVKIIGVIVPQFTHFYFSSILSGIEEEASARGYRIMVAQSNEKYEREVNICKSFNANKVCGIIVSQAKDTTKYDHFQKLIDAGIPLVFYDRICTGVDASRVVVDDYMGAYTAVTHLIDTGCHNIAYYGTKLSLEIGKNRYNGYRDALLKNGLKPNDNWIRECDNRAEAEAITPDLLRGGGGYTRRILRRQRRYGDRHLVFSQKNGIQDTRRHIHLRIHKRQPCRSLRPDAYYRRTAWSGGRRGSRQYPNKPGGGHHTKGQSGTQGGKDKAYYTWYNTLMGMPRHIISRILP